MAVTTTTEVLVDGPRKVVVHVTGIGDGQGQETLEVKVDPSALTPPCERLKIETVTGNVNYGIVKMLWDDGLDPQPFAVMEGYQEMAPIGGLSNSTSDSTGKLLFSTESFEAGSNYDLIIELVKKQ